MRLTAAILATFTVALFAAVLAGFDDSASDRARRAELQSSLNALRLVSLPEAHAHRYPALARETQHFAAVTPATTVCAAAATLVSDTAAARATRRERLDASGAARFARLLASALPPPSRA